MTSKELFYNCGFCYHKDFGTHAYFSTSPDFNTLDASVIFIYQNGNIEAYSNSNAGVDEAIEITKEIFEAILLFFKEKNIKLDNVQIN